MPKLVARFCVLVATALTCVVLILWTSGPGGTMRAARMDAAPALAIPAEADAPDEGTDSWEIEFPRRDSIVPQAMAQSLPDVPGLRRWREDRFWRKQPPDRRPLHAQRLWIDALRVFGNQDDAHLEQARVRRLEEAFAAATDPLVRQNLIFLAVVALPADRAHALLDPIADRGDAQDREDIHGAFAFSGEAEAFERYRALAARPETVSVRRLVDTVAAHNAITDRRILRSYRLIEALDRDLYFDRMYVPHDWLPPPHPDEGRTERLLHLWLARYPGHPGSDDMAYRLGRIAMRRGDHYDAARWFSRASTGPDQWVRRRSPWWALQACAEFLLTRGEIDLLLNDEGFATPNREWLQYTRVRRTAVEEGVTHALAVAAATDANTPVGRAWALRWAARPPRGLDSGMAPLPPHDPLRHVASAAWPPEEPRKDWDEHRLDPPREPMPIPVRKTARQFRIWETLAELQRRAARARGDERTDLLYKQGAIYYHESALALIPTYHRSRHGLRHGTWPLRGALARDVRKSMERAFRESTFGHMIAIRIWESIEAHAYGYPAMDKVIFSQGLGWRRFVDFAYAPVFDATLVKPLVAAMERCTTRFPDSPLADDAARAAAYWRKRASQNGTR